MPVGLRLAFSTMTLDDYDTVSEKLNFPSGSDWPDGLLVHGSHEADGHLVVNDVWESRGHFDRFVEERLGPAIGEALGDRAEQPEIIERELHSFVAREVGPS
jgi:hypothetical protein